MSKKNVIMRRELSSYFISPIAYIVCGLFLVFMGFMFFSTFFIAKRAELRQFFGLLPVMFSFFIPALTMRIFSEEKRSGTIETLITLPVTAEDIVIGKYLASFICTVVMLLPTLFYVVTCYIFGTPDAGPIIGGYVGALLLAAGFCAVGIFASSVTKNQLIAFIVAFAICIFLSLFSNFAILLPAPVVSLITFISAGSHFESISRGIIDTRDILYFISLIALFLSLAVRVVKNQTRG